MRAQAEFDHENGNGSFGSGSHFEIGAAATSIGVYTNEELAIIRSDGFSQEADHLIIGDLSFFASYFFGRQGISSQNVSNFFELRIEGSLSGGLQAWKIIPLTLSLEDGSYIKTNESSRSTALLGSTLYLPVQLTGQSQVLFVALTAGGRWNSELDETAFAIQPKVRLITDRVSSEVRYLMSLGSSDSERKLAGSMALRKVLRSDDEIGIAFSRTWTQGQTEASRRGLGISLHYGLFF